jgi:hypothetical protein
MPIGERLEGRPSLITDLSPAALFLNQPDRDGEAVNEVKVVHYSQHGHVKTAKGYFKVGLRLVCSWIM